ncbi:MAG: MFS transporter [Salinisphaera sp.]|uniref:MFS transporter n=1 Tax=Salinisphaera sp. TaxID=1914330 RepID=UPI003C7A751D
MSDYPFEYAGPSTRTMLIAMLCSITAVGITLGITAPLFSVALAHMGLNSAMVGLNTSLGVGATLVTAPFVPRLLARVNPVPIMFGGILLSAGGLLAAGWLRSAALWFGLRFVIGIGMSLHWVISETYINQFSSEANRGLVAGVYSALFGLGFAIGPLILQATGVGGVAPFVISAALVLAAALPLIWMRGGASAITHDHDAVSMSVLRLAPVIMLASLISGFVDSATLALLPLYGLDLGMSQGRAVALLTIVTLGAVALQLPLGWLADRFGRRATLIGCALASTATAAILPLIIDAPWLLRAVLFLWGGAVVAFYTLALTLLGSAFRGTALARASSALVIAYCLGSVIGPPIAGEAMDLFGANGFVAVMALAALVLAVASVARLRRDRF